MLSDNQILAALGVEGHGNERFVITAAYRDAHDVARVEADPQNERPWPMQPIAKAHKLWLRSNLVNFGAPADMLRVPVHRIHREVDCGDRPEPATAPKHWYWWPDLQPLLASHGLRLPPDATPPVGEEMPRV